MSHGSVPRYTHTISCDWCSRTDKMDNQEEIGRWPKWCKMTSKPFDHGVQYTNYYDVCPDCVEAYFKFVVSRKPSTASDIERKVTPEDYQDVYGP